MGKVEFASLIFTEGADQKGCVEKFSSRPALLGIFTRTPDPPGAVVRIKVDAIKLRELCAPIAVTAGDRATQGMVVFQDR